MTDAHTRLTEMADWIEGCLRETKADLMKIADMEQRRSAYAAAGDLLIDRAKQRGMIVTHGLGSSTTLSAHGLNVEGPSALMLALLQTWCDEARQLLFLDLIDA